MLKNSIFSKRINKFS